ncbi:MAG: phenylacetate--CoA ligase family protein, partial [Candidatus Thorarchaeota archaeon]
PLLVLLFHLGWEPIINTDEKDSLLNGFLQSYFDSIDHFKSEGIDGRDLNLKVIFCSGETLKDSHRNYIEKFFDCKVANDYAASEVGTIAIECPDGNMHIPDESIFVENINPKSSLGEDKELLVTDLHSFNMPIIRYRLGDFANLSNKQCPCGRGLPLMEAPKGRISSMITTSDGKMINSIMLDYIFDQLLDLDCNIKQYQIIQKSTQEFIIKIVGEVNKKHINSIKTKLHKYLGNNTTLNFLSVDDISSAPSGKFKNFINLSDI